MKLTKTKICGSLAVAATIAVFSGCGDESTTNNIDNTAVLAFDADSLPECAKANEGELAFNKTDNTLRICYDTEWYVLNGKDGQKGKTGDQGKKGETGDDGTGCTVKALDDKSGLKLICDGDSLGVVLNGEQGEQGDEGNSCVKCEAVDVTEDGYSIKCGGEVVATILNGSAVPATKSSDSKQTSPASSSSNGVPVEPASSSSNGVPVEPASSSNEVPPVVGESSSSNGVPVDPASSDTPVAGESSSSNGVPVEPASSSNEVPPVVGESSSSEEESLCPTDPESPSGYNAINFPEAYENVLNTSEFSKKPNEGSVKPVEGSIKPAEEKPTIYLADLSYSIICTSTETSAYLTNTWYYALEISDTDLAEKFSSTLVGNLENDGLEKVDETIEEGKIVLDYQDRKKGARAEIVMYSSGEVTLLFSYRESLSATTGGSTSGEGN